MVGPRVTGYYMDIDPIAFAWACLVCTIIAQVFEVLIHFEGSRVRGRSYKTMFNSLFKWNSNESNRESIKTKTSIKSVELKETDTAEL